jgi:ABC-type multidrug transport system ATPase subunit
LGPNGAGKSTTFNILSLGMKRSDGKISLFNENIDKFSSI